MAEQTKDFLTEEKLADHVLRCMAEMERMGASDDELSQMVDECRLRCLGDSMEDEMLDAVAGGVQPPPFLTEK